MQNPESWNIIRKGHRMNMNIQKDFPTFFFHPWKRVYGLWIYLRWMTISLSFNWTFDRRTWWYSDLSQSIKKNRRFEFKARSTDQKCTVAVEQSFSLDTVFRFLMPFEKPTIVYIYTTKINQWNNSRITFDIALLWNAKLLQCSESE